MFSDVVSSNELIKSSHDCRDYVDEAKDFYLIPERRASIDPVKLRGRCCKELVGHIYVIGGLTSAGDSVNFVEHLDCLNEVYIVFIMNYTFLWMPQDSNLIYGEEFFIFI